MIINILQHTRSYAEARYLELGIEVFNFLLWESSLYVYGEVHSSVDKDR